MICLKVIDLRFDKLIFFQPDISQIFFKALHCPSPFCEKVKFYCLGFSLLLTLKDPPSEPSTCVNLLALASAFEVLRRTLAHSRVRDAYNFSVFLKLRREPRVSVSSPLAKVTSREKLAHSLIGISAPCQGHGSELFLVFHVFHLALVWPCQLSKLSLRFLSKWYCLDRMGE